MKLRKIHLVQCFSILFYWCISIKTQKKDLKMAEKEDLEDLHKGINTAWAVTFGVLYFKCEYRVWDGQSPSGYFTSNGSIGYSLGSHLLGTLLQM